MCSFNLLTSLFQWTVAGVAGVLGRPVVRPVVVARGSVVVRAQTHLHFLVGNLAREKRVKTKCATSNHVLVRRGIKKA